MDWLEVGKTIPGGFGLGLLLRMGGAAVLSALFVFFVSTPLIRFLRQLKVGQPIRRLEEAPLLEELHAKKAETPTMGGILMLGAIFLSALLFSSVKSATTFWLLVTTLFFGWVGGIDDWRKVCQKNSRGVRGKKKFLLEVLFCSILTLYLFCPGVAEGLQIGSWLQPPVGWKLLPEGEVSFLSCTEMMRSFTLPCFHSTWVISGGMLLFFALPWSILVVAGSSNAMNLTDGLDGLAAGTACLASSAMALIAFCSSDPTLAAKMGTLYLEQGGEIAIYLSAVAGASAAFLRVNRSPAQLFMGDIGALPVGAILGLSALLLRREVLFALIGGIFLVETLSVILQVASYRWRNQKRIFLCTPLHHHFEYKGWSEKKVVHRFWAVGFFLALMGILAM